MNKKIWVCIAATAIVACAFIPLYDLRVQADPQDTLGNAGVTDEVVADIFTLALIVRGHPLYRLTIGNPVLFASVYADMVNAYIRNEAGEIIHIAERTVETYEFINATTTELQDLMGTTTMDETLAMTAELGYNSTKEIVLWTLEETEFGQWLSQLTYEEALQIITDFIIVAVERMGPTLRTLIIMMIEILVPVLGALFATGLGATLSSTFGVVATALLGIGGAVAGTIGTALVSLGIIGAVSTAAITISAATLIAQPGIGILIIAGLLTISPIVAALPVVISGPVLTVIGAIIAFILGIITVASVSMIIFMGIGVIF